MAPPNLLFFIPDQLRVDALGCFGNPVAHTPHIDALAARGVRFDNAFAQHSVCSPSRVSFLTGWYPHVRGHRTLTHLLQPDEPNLLRLLKDGGYHVAAAGLRGDTFAKGGTQQSTSRFGYTTTPELTWINCPYPQDHPLARAFYHGLRPHPSAALDLDEALTRTALDWLGEGLPEPWALYLPLMFPHPPFEVEEPWFSLHDRAAMPAPVDANLDDKPRYMRALRERYGTDRVDSAQWAEIRATYLGMVSRVDDQLGRILEAVERSGAADRTATFFFTDHGEYLGDYGLVEKWGSGQHDCLLRNPLIVAAPNGARGERCSALVELIDLLPTALEMADLTTSHTHFGRSLSPLLTDPRASHRDAAFAEGGFTLQEAHLLEDHPFPYDLKSAVQQEDPITAGKVASIRTERWTYCYRLYESDEIYDRLEDPQERVNLYGRPEHAETERELRGRILEWFMATADVIPPSLDRRVDTIGAERPR